MTGALFMLRLIGAALAVLAAVPLVAGVTPAAAAVAACFAPQTLAARADEQKPHKGNHTFDASAPEAGAVPLNPVPRGLNGAIRRVDLPPGHKLIALTFDLCEEPGEVAGYDGAIVDTLRAANVKATFFAGGKWLMSHAERARQLIADPLFEIGNHSWDHANLRLRAGAALEEEITGPSRAYASLRTELATRQCLPRTPPVPLAPTLFRFPFGACSADSLAAVDRAGMLAIQWDISTGDPSPAEDAHAILAAMLRARPGSIILNHANGRGHHTAEALPAAIAGLRARGFEFVTVSELLAAGRPVVVPTCYDAHPGDTDKYDTFFLHPSLFHARRRTPVAGAAAVASRPLSRPALSQPGDWTPETAKPAPAKPAPSKPAPSKPGAWFWGLPSP